MKYLMLDFLILFFYYVNIVYCLGFLWIKGVIILFMVVLNLSWKLVVRFDILLIWLKKKNYFIYYYYKM